MKSLGVLGLVALILVGAGAYVLEAEPRLFYILLYRLR